MYIGENREAWESFVKRTGHLVLVVALVEDRLDVGHGLADKRHATGVLHLRRGLAAEVAVGEQHVLLLEENEPELTQVLERLVGQLTALPRAAHVLRLLVREEVVKAARRARRLEEAARGHGHGRGGRAQKGGRAGGGGRRDRTHLEEARRARRGRSKSRRNSAGKRRTKPSKHCGSLRSLRGKFVLRNKPSVHLSGRLSAACSRSGGGSKKARLLASGLVSVGRLAGLDALGALWASF